MFKYCLKSLKTNLLLSLVIVAFGCSEAEPGVDGTNGINGFNALVVVDDEAAGENCATGGIKISVGQDANENGELDTDEIASISFVCNGSSGNDGDTGPTLAARTSPELPGENCEAGGTLVEIGADTNGNASLDDDEVQTSFFVCNGIDGADGADGSGAGENGLTSLIRATPLEDCGPDNTTGVQIEIGLDKNGNGELDSSADPDINEIQASYEICDGADGQDGADGTPGDNGMNALIGISTFSGEQNGCLNGGLRIAAGLDIDGDGALQGGEELNVEFICNGENGNDGATGDAGADGRSVLVTINEDPTECANGGIEIVLEYDNDGDGTGDESIGSYIICDGADGATGPAGNDGVGLLIRKSPSDVADCPNGGTLVEIDRDENGNGLFDDGAIDVSFDVCNGANGDTGAAGDVSLIDVFEFSGSLGDCSNGGLRIRTGVDSDGSGSLELGEYTEFYVCNGGNGNDGSDGNTDGVYELFIYTGFNGYTQSQDTYIDQSDQETVFDKTGISVSAGDVNYKYGLLRFDGIDEVVKKFTDNHEILQAQIYLTGSASAANENYVGVKELTTSTAMFEQTKANYLTPDGDSQWSGGSTFDTAKGDASPSYMDTYQLLPIAFEGIVPLQISRSMVDGWIKAPSSNKGLVLEMASTANTKQINFYDSENEDPYLRPVLYIKIQDLNALGRTTPTSEKEYKARWESLTYEEKLAPLRNRD